MIKSRRDICYRAKSKRDKRWVYGGYFQHIKRQLAPIGDRIRECDIEDLILYDSSADWNMPCGIECEEIDYKTLGRYLEMKDNHKNKIYEDDIVEFSVGKHKDRYLLYFNKELSCMLSINTERVRYNGVDYYERSDDETPFDLFCFMMQNPYGDFTDIRVIGNRHDNPELLNVHMTE